MTTMRVREWGLFNFLGMVCGMYWFCSNAFLAKGFLYHFNISKAKVKMKSRFWSHSVSKECHHWQSVFAWRNVARFVKFRIRTYKCALFGKWNPGGECLIFHLRFQSTFDTIKYSIASRCTCFRPKKENGMRLMWFTHTHIFTLRV